MAESNNFDIIEALLTRFSGGWTGQNISRQIFSHLGFASLLESRLVCKLWNKFLTEDTYLWMEILKKSQPYLEYFSQKFCCGRCEEPPEIEGAPCICNQCTKRTPSLPCQEMSLKWTQFFKF